MKKELDYFKIDGGYGGNQSWFEDITMKIGGCAAVAACDSCICLDRLREEAGLYPFDRNRVSQEDFLRFAAGMKPYLRPRLGGVSRLDIFIKGMRRYLKGIGERDMRVEGFSGKGSTEEACSLFIRQIDEGYPVPYLNLLHRDEEFRSYQWHWFVLAGYERQGDRLLAKAVTYGGVRWLDFRRLWDGGSGRKGGMILFQDMKRARGLCSPWGRQIDAEHVLEEYPRPSMVRDHWMNLNGIWECEITGEKAGEKDEPVYKGRILVPFSPESDLSGVGHILQPDEILSYRRIFTLPEGDDGIHDGKPAGAHRKDRLLLHFGAVDQECRVYVNGQQVGEHRGGYLAFTCDITEAVREGRNELALTVRDRTEYAPHARGKQKLVKKGKYSALFYTPQSGIWKSVWLERVPACGIEDLKLTPDVDRGQIRILVRTRRMGVTEKGDKRGKGNGENRACVVISYKGEELLKAWTEADKWAALTLPRLFLWSPANPALYDVTVSLGEDKVSSYFAMRSFTIETDRRGNPRFCLNHEPVFFHGVLDQGYWPESLMTPPSDEALCHDILKLKELGYNTIRKHIKIESERFYYHCDRLGMMVWQDMPNGGGDYSMLFVTYLPNIFRWFGRCVRDYHYRWFRREDEAGRGQYYRDLEGMVTQLGNHPSVAAWVLFNEGWGQFDAGKATACVRRLDGGRLINEACGWFDQGGGDMYSIHNYLWRLKLPAPGRAGEGRAVALSEYGGYALAVRDHMDSNKMPEGKSFGYGSYEDRKALSDAYRKLLERDIYPHLDKGLSAAIYTQVSDIETEINGLMTYDREVDKFDALAVRACNERLYELFRQSI